MSHPVLGGLGEGAGKENNHPDQGAIVEYSIFTTLHDLLPHFFQGFTENQSSQYLKCNPPCPCFIFLLRIYHLLEYHLFYSFILLISFLH